MSVSAERKSIQSGPKSARRAQKQVKINTVTHSNQRSQIREQSAERSKSRPKSSRNNHVFDQAVLQSSISRRSQNKNRDKSRSKTGRSTQHRSSDLRANDKKSDREYRKSIQIKHYQKGNLIEHEARQTFGLKADLNNKSDQQSSSLKVRSNTEIFQELLLKTHHVQSRILSIFNHHNNQIKLMQQQSSQLSLNQQDKLILIHDFPQVAKKARSFKEIAQGLIEQIAFIIDRDLIRPQDLSNDNQFDLNQQNEQQDQFDKNNANIHLNLQSDKQQPQIISMQKLQEIKDRDNQIEDQKKELAQMKHNNEELMNQLHNLTVKHAEDREKLKNQVGLQHLEIEKNFEMIQKDHLERVNQLKKQMEQITYQKNEELADYYEQVRSCQIQIKQLNLDREKRRCSSIIDQNDGSQNQFQDNQMANYLDFGQKNMPQIQAELDYYVEKTNSLEAELKTMSLELLYRRTEKDDVAFLKSNLEATESQLKKLKQENEHLNQVKDLLERELNSQKQSFAQESFRKSFKQNEPKLHNDNQNLNDQGSRESIGETPVPRTHELVPVAHSYDNKPPSKIATQINQSISPNYKNAEGFDRPLNNRMNGKGYELPFQKTISTFSYQSSNQKLRQDKYNGGSENTDFRNTIKSQAEMIEKLIQKNKKLKQNKMDKEFPGIFNLNRNDTMNGTNNDAIQSKYQNYMNELYELLLKQNGNGQSMRIQNLEDQYIEIKSFLNLSAQMGSLRKFRFDERFSDILKCSELQNIHDAFYNKQESKFQLADQSNLNSKALYMNSEKQIQIKNECFEQLYQLFCDNIGQFYIIYSQMHFQRDRCNDLQDQLNNIRQSSQSIAMQLEDITPDQVDSLAFYKLKDGLKQEKMFSKGLEIANQNLTDAMTKMRQQIQFYETKSDIIPSLFDSITQLVTINQFNVEDRNQKELANNQSSSKKPPSTQNKKLKRSGSQKYQQNRSSVFSGKKCWLNDDGIDPDLNQAIDKIDKITKQLQDIEDENGLLQAENKKYLKDIQNLESVIQAESATRLQLETAKQEFEEQSQMALKKLKDKEKVDEENVQKIERLTALNKELRELIDQEREANHEDIVRLEKQMQLKLKHQDTKTMILKNKLMHLANKIGAYISQSFSHEQIVDAIMDQKFSSKHPNNKRKSSNHRDKQITHDEYDQSRSIARDSNESRIVNHVKTKDQQIRKRKIKIDYRNKKIEEEYVNYQSDSSDHVDYSQASPKKTFTQESRVSRSQSLEEQNKNLNGQTPNTKQGSLTKNYSYKTADPSEAMSIGYTNQECDLPSQIHRRIGTYDRVHNMNIQDGVLKSNIKSDIEQDEDKIIRSKSKKRLQQMFEHYNKDIQNLNSDFNQEQILLFKNQRSQQESHQQRSIMQEESRPIKVFVGSRSRSRSKKNSQTQHSQSSEVQIQNQMATPDNISQSHQNKQIHNQSQYILPSRLVTSVNIAQDEQFPTRNQCEDGPKYLTHQFIVQQDKLTQDQASINNQKLKEQNQTNEKSVALNTIEKNLGDKKQFLKDVTSQSSLEVYSQELKNIGDREQNINQPRLQSDQTLKQPLKTVHYPYAAKTLERISSFDNCQQIDQTNLQSDQKQPKYELNENNIHHLAKSQLTLMQSRSTNALPQTTNIIHNSTNEIQQQSQNQLTHSNSLFSKEHEDFLNKLNKLKNRLNKDSQLPSTVQSPLNLNKQ